jgi:hypothetical protein
MFREEWRLDSTYEDNANSVTLQIASDDGEIEITVYDLPRHVTAKLHALADGQTTKHERVEAA